jgi:hypothetical protein
MTIDSNILGVITSVLSSVFTAIILVILTKKLPSIVHDIKSLHNINNTLDNLRVKFDTLNKTINDESAERIDHEKSFATSEVFNSRIYLILTHTKLMDKGTATYSELKDYQDAYHNYESLITMSGIDNGVMEKYYNDVLDLSIEKESA